MADDRPAQFGRAVHRGVLRLPGFDRDDRRVLDVARRLEVRLAQREVEDVTSGDRQFARPRRRGQAG